MSDQSLISRRFSIWILFLLSAATLLTENFLDWPLGIPRMKRLSGGLKLLDLRLGYDGQSVYQLFDALGSDGRNSYLWLLWTVDVWLPFICASFLSAAIVRGRFSFLWWTPAFVAVSDYAENIAITVLLRWYPTQLPTLVLLSSSLTLLKYAGYLAVIVVSIAGSIRQRKTIRE